MELSKTFRQIKAYANAKQLPLIAINAKGVSLLDKPNSFYKFLLDSTKTVKNRLTLSSLYLGTESKELALVQSICDRLERQNVDTTIILDANRANRLDENKQSSLTLLKPLSSLSQVHISLMNLTTNTSLVMQLLSKFSQKWKEVGSTYHAKMMVFDDNVLVTGANLSSIYFEHRQDRYMLIKDCKLLSNYVHNLMRDLGSESDLKQTIAKHNEKFISQSTQESSDSYIIPLIQCGQTGVRQKEDFLNFLSTILPDNSRVYLSSGYFNPSPVVEKLKIHSVLAPSEEANGFFKGGGLLKYVPRLYSAIHKQYLDTHEQCRLQLYDRAGWSFHAKGLWVVGLDDLYLHLTGSSNYNCRATERDFELQLLLVTRDKELIGKLELERQNLWRNSRQAGNFSGLNIIYHALSKLFKPFL